MFDNRWENWASDYSESTEALQWAGPVRDHVSEILQAFGEAVRTKDPDFPDEISPGTFVEVLGTTMTRLQLDDAVRRDIPEVIAGFLDYLQETGRLGEGRDWAAQIRVIGSSFRERLKPDGGVKGVTIRKSKDVTPLGRNDPCPCGSGKKFKKCCGARGS